MKDSEIGSKPSPTFVSSEATLVSIAVLSPSAYPFAFVSAVLALLVASAAAVSIASCLAVAIALVKSVLEAPIASAIYSTTVVEAEPSGSVPTNAFNEAHQNWENTAPAQDSYIAETNYAEDLGAWEESEPDFNEEFGIEASE